MVRGHQGTVVTEKAFISTSTDPAVATGTFDGNTLMIITGHSGRDIADEALEQLYRDLAAAAERPAVEVHSPGKFDGPVGMLDDGTFQPPLTEEEKQHNEEVRHRAPGGKS